MLARGYLWDYPSIAGVNINLGGDHIGEDSLSILDHSSRCLIAGCLDAKDLHITYISDRGLKVNRHFWRLLKNVRKDFFSSFAHPGGEAGSC